MKDLISVIIPAYNAEKSLSRTLDSVLKQDYGNLEIIVINDGSTDLTEDLVNQYQAVDCRVVLINQANGGVSSARNKGIHNARGMYITFLDADDTFEVNFVSSLYSAIHKDNSDIAYCGFSYLTETGKTNKNISFTKNDVLIKYFLNQLPIHTSSWLIRKSYLDQFKIRFKEGVSWGEDIEFFTQVLAHSKNLTYVNQYLSNYYIGDEESLSAFNLDKLDLDYNSIQRILGNESLNLSEKEQSALLNYRLPALLAFRLLEASNRSYDKKDIKTYYDQYQNDINKFKFNNGLRSVKLYMAIKKLNKMMR